MLFRTNAQTEDMNGDDKTAAGTRVSTRARAAQHTDFRLIWVLLGLVAVLTVGFCYLFSYILRLANDHRRNGERMKDLIEARLYEQDKKH